MEHDHDTYAPNHATGKTATPPAGDAQHSRADGKRDADRARAAAKERMETARRVSEAVDLFHDAADRIDAAHNELRDATRVRTEAICKLRGCGLSVPEISTLTGLSTSRIQALTGPQRTN
jgi:hypothetical protein